ncbi:MAG TPA: hypothetical protein VFE89_16380 [Beijerinckiaceae bacterium]|nr:hypothetical protein [Beijerinckiaceae bacterium]
MLQADVRDVAIIDDRRHGRRQADRDALHLIGLERMLSAHRLDRVERRRIGEPTVHFLMSVSAIS